MKHKDLARYSKHGAAQHITAPRLEGVVKNKGTKPVHKKKKEMLAMLFPEWLVRAQDVVRTLKEGVPEAIVVSGLSVEVGEAARI